MLLWPVFAQTVQMPTSVDIAPILQTGLVGTILLLIVFGKLIVPTWTKEEQEKAFREQMGVQDRLLDVKDEQIAQYKGLLEEREKDVEERDHFIREQFIVQQSAIVERQVEVLQRRLSGGPGGITAPQIDSTGGGLVGQ